MPFRILVVDDDAIACEFLEEALSRSGYPVQSRTSASDALQEDLSQYDLMISDVRMPGTDGLQLLREVRKRAPDLPVLLMTAYGSLENTMEALQLGAWDYISKPFSPDHIRSKVQKLFEIRKFQQLNRESRQPPSKEMGFVGSSPVMVEFYKQLVRLAGTNASLLIEGESGTGKELTVRALHEMSLRRGLPFLAVHCGAIPETLLESELFGYEKGAFTGADHSHPGLIEQARGGTIFLDEITEMSPALQGKLLRFMQNGEVRRLGGHGVYHSTVRVLAATNRDVDDEVKKGRFRPDLLYRFIIRLRVPPLREHIEDLPLLAETHLKKLGYRNVRISDEALELLMGYEWPGNVRELENVIQETMLLAPFSIIVPEHLPARFRSRTLVSPSSLSPLETAEKVQIEQALKAASWNLTRSAAMLGIDRKTLRSKIQRYALSRDEG
jgi:DNA-binding NtrC family response regulator